uniref:Uncharacterized protein n=1 Tax=Podarcis muralis TaxID=64176 RepID=A0A670JZT1_PODMU
MAPGTHGRGAKLALLVGWDFYRAGGLTFHLIFSMEGLAFLRGQLPAERTPMPPKLQGHQCTEHRCAPMAQAIVTQELERFQDCLSHGRKYCNDKANNWKTVTDCAVDHIHHITSRTKKMMESLAAIAL